MKFSLIALGFLFAGFIANASDKISCTNSNGKIYIKFERNGVGSASLVPGKEVCDFSWSTGVIGDDVIILLSPDEAGINASQRIYFYQNKKRMLSSSGYLPVAADKIGEGMYQTINQDGGSVYLTKFRFENKKIQTMSPVMELVVDGRVCLKRNGNISLLEMSGEKISSCKKVISSKGSEGVCIQHNEDSALMVNKGLCDTLVNAWKNGL